MEGGIGIKKILTKTGLHFCYNGRRETVVELSEGSRSLQGIHGF